MSPKNITIHLQHPTTKAIFPLELIYVEGGKAQIGEDEGKHWINIPSFYIGKYPVTQGLYEFVLGKAANHSRFQSQDRPVENVSWNDTQIFLQKLNQEFINGYSFRLPSESEWEYAARGGKHWRDGLEYAGSNEVNEVAWHWENAHRETFPVGFKKPNQLGIYDMSGNVDEWCADDWHDNFQDAPKDGSAWVDKPRSYGRLLRGGAWYYNPEGCRVAIRDSSEASNRSLIIGLRLALPQFKGSL